MVKCYNQERSQRGGGCAPPPRVIHNAVTYVLFTFFYIFNNIQMYASPPPGINPGYAYGYKYSIYNNRKLRCIKNDKRLVINNNVFNNRRKDYIYTVQIGK